MTNNNDFNNMNNDEKRYNEYSYQPQNIAEVQTKSRGKSVAKVLGIIACAIAISVGSISAYSYATQNKAQNGLSAEGTSSSDIGTQLENTSSASSTSESSSDGSTLSGQNWITLAARKDALTVPEIVKKVMPSVVGISSTLYNGTSTGTGIVMSEDGYIITNAHVVEGANAVSVMLQDETEYEAEIIGCDTETDIAVLKINVTGLTPAEFGDSNDVEVGELAIAIGNPLGFELFGSVTGGIVSAVNREVTLDDERVMKLIQTDAAINSGNSGGPLVNSYGQVIGINSIKISSNYSSATVEGLGFAIPIGDAQTIINDLINYGYVTGRPQIGISCEDISAMYARYYNIPQGTMVKYINPDGPAANSGLQVGDVIIGANGQEISSLTELNEIKKQLNVGDTLTLTVSRNNQEIDIKIVLAETKQ